MDKTSDGKIPEIIEWIRTHIHEDISLSSVAFEFNYSCEHLSRIFKKKRGISVNQYINKLKIAKAKELLLLTDYTVNEITKIIGYNDDKYFYRVFKKHEDLTPKEYRYAYNKTHRNIK